MILLAINGKEGKKVSLINVFRYKNVVSLSDGSGAGKCKNASLDKTLQRKLQHEIPARDTWCINVYLS